MLQHARLLDESLVRLREKVVLLDLVVRCRRLCLIALVVGLLALRLSLGHSQHRLMHLLLLLLLLSDLLIVHSAKLLCRALHERVWLEAVEVLLLLIDARIVLLLRWPHTTNLVRLIVHLGCVMARKLLKRELLRVEPSITLAARAEDLLRL